jgi:hypothetical protein
MDTFKRIHETGRFEIWRRQDGNEAEGRRDAESRPIAELSPSNVVSNVRWARDELTFTLEAGYARARILVKTSFHPWWRIEGPPRAWLRESPEGFLVVDDIPKGRHEIRLRYQPGNLPGRVSALGWVLLAGWAGLVAWQERRGAAGKPAGASA